METDERYPVEVLNDNDDDGTMVENVDALRQAVVGHRIVKAQMEQVEHRWGARYGTAEVFVLTLDNGRRVQLADTDDCCAYTDLAAFLLHPEAVDHVIMGVGTTDEYTVWHIYADFGDVLTLEVGWSCGNPFYYGYGFDIKVIDA